MKQIDLDGVVYLGRAIHSSGSFAAGEPVGILQHYTAGSSGKASAYYLQGNNDRKVSCHFTIDRDGAIYQCGDLDQRLHHAGASSWKEREGLNKSFIGIENANWGFWRPGIQPATQAAAREKGWLSATHKNGGPELLWELYPEPQMEANERLCRKLLEVFPKIKYMIGHDDASPGRKQDPGPAFPIGRFRSLLVPEDVMTPQTFIVNATMLNVRGGPGTNFEVLKNPAPLKKGTKVKMLRDAGDWAYIEVGDAQGWVFDQYISPV